MTFDQTNASVLSQTARARLGVDALGIPSEHAGNTSDPLADSLDAVRELEQFCKTSNETGLKCCLSAAAHLRDRTPTASNAPLRSNLVPLTSTWSVEGKPPPEAQVVFAPHDVHAAGPTDTLRIAETAYRVIDRLSKGVTFAEQASIPARLSEALFRVLRTDTYPGEVIKVAVQLEQAAAVETPPTSARKLPGDGPRADVDLRTPPVETPAETDWWARHGMSTMSQTEFKAALASADPGVLQGTRNLGVTLLPSRAIIMHAKGWSNSSALFRKTGAVGFGHRVIWSEAGAFGALGFSPERVEHMIKAIASNSAGRGLDGLLTLAVELATSLPEQPQVQFYAKFSGTLRDASVAPNFLRNAMKVTITVNRNSEEALVDLVLPEIHGFITPGRSGPRFVGICLKGSLNRQRDPSDIVDISMAAAKAVEAATEIAGPIFTTVKSAALDSHIAQKIAAALVQALTAVSTSAMINSPGAFREQLFMNFVTNFTIVAMMSGGKEILAQLHDWFTPRGKAMAAATDCLLITQFAHDANLDRYRSEGGKQHSLAINALRRSLSKPEAVSDDDALSATDALGVYEAMGLRELFTGLPQGEDTWRQHSRGLCTLLQLRGPQCLSSPSEHLHGMIFNAMQAGLGDSISSRKAFTLGGPHWQRALESSCSGRVCLADPDSEALEVLTELIDIQHKLQEWLFAWYDEMPDSPFRTVSVTTYPSFIAEHGPLADQFPVVFTFPSFVEAMGLIGYWTMLLFVKEAIFDLSTRPYALEHTTQRQRDAFCRDVYECADAICQCAPHFLSPKTASEECQWQAGGGARDLYGSMFWSVRWYEKQKDNQKLEFCKSVLGTQMPGQRDAQQPPSSAPVDDWT
ncbi:hypothetical protein B0A55_08781 [Friedmanniomyces simplex]|uniref:Uncharacterized protein n=1 Tax=Friedmanniomyces simplex TaxID=329884 RepID=A0A4U0WWR3_9PEZI|nr:hypothetical protein B0A55_08781 [Friedmanniomyces simplex]